MVAWGEENFPNVDGEKETAKFIDHFRAASGANAVKKDWIAAWRNWIRRAEKDYPQPLGSSRAASKPSTTDQRVADGMALAARLAAQDGVPLPALFDPARLELEP